MELNLDQLGTSRQGNTERCVSVTDLQFSISIPDGRKMDRLHEELRSPSLPAPCAERRQRVSVHVIRSFDLPGNSDNMKCFAPHPHKEIGGQTGGATVAWMATRTGQLSFLARNLSSRTDEGKISLHDLET